MKIFVTGLTGFIGRHVLPLLLKGQYEIYALTRQEQAPLENVVWCQGDFLDEKFMSSLIQDIQPGLMLHLAWDVEPGYQSSERNYEWLWASFNLWRNFIRSGGQRAVFAGTCFEYDLNNERCEEDVTPLRPQSTYGKCKNILRELVEDFAENRGVSYTWGRIFYPFGPGEHSERFFPSLIRAALERKPVVVNAGQQIRDFIYVKDAASAFLTLLETDVCGVFNVASGVPCSRKGVAEEICSIINCRQLLQTQTLPTGEPDSFFADICKLKDLGWSPSYTLGKALMEIVKQ